MVLRSDRDQTVNLRRHRSVTDLANGDSGLDPHRRMRRWVEECPSWR